MNEGEGSSRLKGLRGGGEGAGGVKGSLWFESELFALEGRGRKEELS